MTPFSEATNPEQSLTIQLTNGAQTVREIYFADGRRNVSVIRMCIRLIENK